MKRYLLGKKYVGCHQGGQWQFYLLSQADARGKPRSHTVIGVGQSRAAAVASLNRRLRRLRRVVSDLVEILNDGMD